MLSVPHLLPDRWILRLKLVYKQTSFIFYELFIEYIKVWPIYWVINLTDTATKSLGLWGRGPKPERIVPNTEMIEYDIFYMQYEKTQRNVEQNSKV